MTSKEYIKFLFLALIIDLAIIWIYVYVYEQPDPSISIAAILIAPALLVINIIAGLVLLVFKSKFSKILFANSILSPVIFFGIWTLWYSSYSQRYYTEFSFYSDNKLHELSLEKNSDFFNISDISTQESGFTTGLYSGRYSRAGDTLILIDNQIKMYVLDNNLIGFPDSKSKIKVEKK